MLAVSRGSNGQNAIIIRKLSQMLKLRKFILFRQLSQNAHFDLLVAGYNM